MEDIWYQKRRSIDVDRTWKGGEQLHWFDFIVSATSLYLKFPLLIGRADELFVSLLSQSQDHCGFSWVPCESTKDREHWGRWCTCRALCLSTWMGTVAPAHERQSVLWFRSKQPNGGAERHESQASPPVLQLKNKNKYLWQSLHFLAPRVCRARIHLV